MVEGLWVLFFAGAGVLWVALIYLFWDSSIGEDIDEHWPIWRVLLHGDQEREEAAHSRPSECRAGEEGG